MVESRFELAFEFVDDMVRYLLNSGAITPEMYEIRDKACIQVAIGVEATILVAFRTVPADAADIKVGFATLPYG